MAYKVILAQLTGGKSDLAVLQLAWQVAHRFGAAVRAGHYEPDPAEAAALLAADGAFVVQSRILDDFAKMAEERAAAAKATYDRWRQEHHIGPAGGGEAEAEWIDLVGRLDRLAGYGRSADLIITGRPEDSSADNLDLVLETALFRTGRPVLLAPPGNAAAPLRRALIAWNDSAESARALAGALPLLTTMDGAIVLGLGDEDQAPEGFGAVADLVRRHGVVTEPVWQKVASGSEGERLLAIAAEENANLLVMGAYTHGRLRQALLGGVTRHVLGHAALPLLMAH